jgi:hypothetical protein
VCGCPAKFTCGQLEYFRSEHLQRGGLVSSAAPNQVRPEDLSAGEVLLAPLTLVLFSAFPTDLLASFKEESAGWLLVLAGPGLFRLCDHLPGPSSRMRANRRQLTFHIRKPASNSEVTAMAPNPSTERTPQRPLRARCAAAHVER